MNDELKTSRDAFEKWARSNGFIAHKNNSGDYSAINTRYAWEAWQAAVCWADAGEIPGVNHEAHIDSVSACRLL